MDENGILKKNHDIVMRKIEDETIIDIFTQIAHLAKKGS